MYKIQPLNTEFFLKVIIDDIIDLQSFVFFLLSPTSHVSPYDYFLCWRRATSALRSLHSLATACRAPRPLLGQLWHLFTLSDVRSQGLNFRWILSSICPAASLPSPCACQGVVVSPYPTLSSVSFFTTLWNAEHLLHFKELTANY